MGSPKRRSLLGDRNASGIKNQVIADPLDPSAVDAAGILPDLDKPAAASPLTQPDAADAAAAQDAVKELKTQPAPGPVEVPVGEGSLAASVTAEPAPEDAPEPEVESWPVAEIPGVRADDTTAEAEPETPESTPAAESAPAAPQATAPVQEQTDTRPMEAPAGEEKAMTAPAVAEVPAKEQRTTLVADENAVNGLDRYADSRNKSRAATDQITVTITNDALVEARCAFASDQDTLDPHPSSFAKWIQRAVHIHLSRSPQERAEALSEAKRRAKKPESRERKKSYNVPMPYDLHLQLIAAVAQERKAGRITSKSELARDAMFIEVVVSTERAGGELPVLVGKLPHAR